MPFEILDIHYTKFSTVKSALLLFRFLILSLIRSLTIGSGTSFLFRWSLQSLNLKRTCKAKKKSRPLPPPPPTPSPYTLSLPLPLPPPPPIKQEPPKIGCSRRLRESRILDLLYPSFLHSKICEFQVVRDGAGTRNLKDGKGSKGRSEQLRSCGGPANSKEKSLGNEVKSRGCGKIRHFPDPPPSLCQIFKFSILPKKFLYLRTNAILSVGGGKKGFARN